LSDFSGEFAIFKAGRGTQNRDLFSFQRTPNGATAMVAYLASLPDSRPRDDDGDKGIGWYAKPKGNELWCGPYRTKKQAKAALKRRPVWS
jgi:hypothetical protein